MAGYIDNSSDLALFESYSQGRALAGARLENLSKFAQWSALMDDKTCDWCSWADLRVFDTTIEPYDPPMHHGCRCLVAYITNDEFPPTETWGSGPPSSAWPPGSLTKTERSPVFESFERDAMSVAEIESLRNEFSDWPDDPKGIADQAIFENAGTLVTARAEQNKLVGIMHYRDLSKLDLDDLIELTNIATSGEISGTGTALMEIIAKASVNSGLPIELRSVPTARGFYRRLGMIEDAGGVFQWAPEDAAKFLVR